MEFEKFSQQLPRMLNKDSDLNALSLEEILDLIPRVDELSELPSGTPVLVRLDLNVPVHGGQILDTSRIESCIHTLKYCLQRGWKIVVLGHIGHDEGHSLEPISDVLGGFLGRDIEFVEHWLDVGTNTLEDDFVEHVRSSDAESIFLLENARKYAFEKALWDVDDRIPLAVLEDLYSIGKDIRLRLAAVQINEAIAASNVDFSSCVVPLMMAHTCMGFHFAQEMTEHVRNLVNGAVKLIVFSGLKVKKLDDLEGILDNNNLTMLISAGALAMALRKAQAQLEGTDFSIGLAETDPLYDAYIDENRLAQAKQILTSCEKQGIEVVLPVDFILDNGNVSSSVPFGHAQMDVGPKSCARFEEKINLCIEKSMASDTPFLMFYNGVFGKFEERSFEAGTKLIVSLLKRMTRAGIQTYVGGGEGRLALTRYGSIKDVTHSFTCGGTVLKSLSGNQIGYLKAMYIQNKERSAPN